MPLHYKKDGSLDMRYSSSKAAVSSGFSSRNCGSSSRSTGSCFSSDLNYKKDGSLDMRYSSSKTAMSSGYNSGSPFSTGDYSSSSSSDLHYKKDGSLDMRYNSSKAAMSLGHYSGSPFSAGDYSSRSSSDLHYKKDGSLDMRYKSSREGMKLEHLGASDSVTNIHLKKDGTPDMRYKTSDNLISGMKRLSVGENKKDGVPRSIPQTKSGQPDMRTSAAKEWVAQQAANEWASIPSWVPVKKDGTVDTTKAVGRAFLLANVAHSNRQDHEVMTLREEYYQKRSEQPEFRDCIKRARDASVRIPNEPNLPNTVELKCNIAQTLRSQSSLDIEAGHSLVSVIPSSIPLLDYRELQLSFAGKEEECMVGRGAFGIVLKVTWKGETVAVKRLHLTQLTRQEKKHFVNELVIIALLGEHPNLVKLYGYVLRPPCLVMEFVSLGSLSYLLHYCEDASIEARMTDGRVKKRLAVGVVAGMRQLHSVGVVHGDLKPQNVLVTDDYTSKIADFGLSTLRSKSSSSVGSSALEDGESLVVGGTAAYMAPELLDVSHPPEPSSDVYSFAILLNELLQEEEPFGCDYAKFQGRGPFAAALYARQGNRPRKSSRRIPQNVSDLIEKCWSQDAKSRPTFNLIASILQEEAVQFPDSI